MHTAEQSENPDVLIGLPAVHPCTEALKTVCNFVLSSGTLELPDLGITFVCTCVAQNLDSRVSLILVNLDCPIHYKKLLQ